MHRKRDSHGEGRAARQSAAVKLFVLDTNVLMHDPTSLFRFEEHDVYLPMVTLEELDDNKKGMSEVARNARQASRFLDEIVSSGGRRHRERLFAQGQDARRRARAALPADARRHGGDPRLGRLAEGRQRDPRRGHAPQAAPPEAPGRAGVQGHQHAHQGACDRARGRGLLQRQGARGHRPPLHRHAGAARGLLGPARQGRRELAGARPHALPREGAAVPVPPREPVRLPRGRPALLRHREGREGASRARCRRSRTTRTTRTTSGASPRGTASRTSR